MFSKQIGIDLGTANVLVYVRGKGIVLQEPSVVAISTSENAIMAVGREAQAMLGRTPGSVSVVRPMRDGVIADYVITEAMLRYFIKRVVGAFSLVKPDVMICIPAGVTSVEQRAVHDATIQAGARNAWLIEEPLAAAIGAKIPIHVASGNMVVDIGGGTTEAAIISLNGIVEARSVRVAGNKMDDAIATYIKRKYNLMIGERMAEEVKIQIGSALPLEQELTMEVRGRDQVGGLPKTITVRSSEVREAIAEPLAAIVAATKSVLELTPPELASDVIDKGIILTGGGALLRGIDRLLTLETGVPCYVADNPLACVAIGAGLALERIEVLRRNLPVVDN
ncbi:MAG TPA: rod shape-determining protein [Chloroflexota bacterium]|jgi:rod shape-determining protein MreB|nr:rod shape-determining protein [Chloroflexota bacterium]